MHFMWCKALIFENNNHIDYEKAFIMKGEEKDLRVSFASLY